VAANAGWYTVVDGNVRFPYGLDGAPVGDREIAAALASNLVVLLGADDIESDDGNLRHDAQTDAQGRTRLDRGLYFYRAGRQTADDRSLPFRWQLSVVPGIGHSHTEMARAAAPILLGPPGAP
jgi:hypothetical protein